MTSRLLSDRQNIRRAMFCLRQSLTQAQQRQAAEHVTEKALNFSLIRQAKTLALYFSVNDELDTHPLITQLWQQKKQLYLPVLHPFARGQLLFFRYDPASPLKLNRFGIPEPYLNLRHLLPLNLLDVVFIPLVGFDNEGHRLGMGGGFYDRTLQRCQQYHFTTIGLAYDCQYVERLPYTDWDVPLSVVITPSKLWQWG